MSEEIILEARDIWHSYEENDRFSLQGLDLKVKKGSKVAFMGANGSGKSTFFLCCNGILRPQKGDILFHGKPVSYKRKELLALRASCFRTRINSCFLPAWSRKSHSGS